jgi:hypothetical protein
MTVLVATASGVGVAAAAGPSWAIQTTPNPPAVVNSVLHGVSCATATACTAVGDYRTDTNDLSFAESWGGSKWSFQHTANPSTFSSVLRAVSCTATTACTAVGDHFSSGTHLTLAERWDGAGWGVQQTPTSKNSGGLLNRV